MLACPVGCGRSRRRAAELLCPICWRKVPKPLQRAVYRAWDARQKSPRDEGRIAAHEAAKAAAIRSVP